MYTINEIQEQEKSLRFNYFSSETAWEIGSMLVEKGRKENLSITIDISRNGHQLFHYSFDGTSADNDNWVRRKTNLVNRFGRSSLLIGKELKESGKTLEEKYMIAEADFAPHGGCFPIYLKGTGPVGTITVSGLAQEEDHRAVVETIESYLRKNG
ncbi:MAG: heme-degrading domain-containing protein [Spirochaetales bacterium]|nr:heme-degrading domain-containing protein [Spirochaetales bacterium]